jgi:UDP-glucuronate decarboxylase
MPGEIDYIIHAASQASPKYYGVDPVGTLSANVLGTHHLLELAKLHKTKGFLYFSSGEVYGEVDSEQVPINEKNYGYLDPMHIRSCYAESKRMGENMCVSYAHQYQLHVNIARPFHIYGPGISLDDGRVYADFVADIFHNRDITIYGAGTAIRSFCYLADATLGFFTLLLNGENAEAYNIGNPDCCLSIMELAVRLRNLFNDRQLKVVRKSRSSQSEYLESKISINIPDIKKIQALGWSPKITIEEGFLRTMRSLYEFDCMPG